MSHLFDDAGFTDAELLYLHELFRQAGVIAEFDPAAARAMIKAGAQEGPVDWTQAKLAAMRAVIYQARFEVIAQEGGLEDG